MKKKFLMPVIIVSLIFATGCWNYREIDKLAIVAGMSVDKSQKGDGYLVTAEIIDLQSGGRETKVSSKRVESEGRTIFDAIRNIIKISAKKLYWSHTKVFIVSQDIAKESILPVLDWVNRDQEPRLNMDILISKEKTAKELLSQKSVTTDIRTFEIEYMLESNNILSKSLKTPTYELINSLAGEGISLTLPTLGITINDGYPTSELSGVAVFEKDKLLGFLSEEDTKSLLFVRNKIEGGLLTLKQNPSHPFYDITLEIFENKTKVKPIYSENELLMDVNTRTILTIAEHDLPNSYIDEEGRNKLAKDMERLLEINIENLIKNVQKDYGVDIFGFGRIIKAEMPSLWRSVKDDWNEMFRSMKVKIHSEIEIRGSGLSYKSIEVGD